MNNIEVLRKNAGMTRRELGERVGVVDTTVYSWERMGRTPDMATAIKLADVFEVSLDHLMGRSSP